MSPGRDPGRTIRPGFESFGCYIRCTPQLKVVLLSFTRSVSKAGGFVPYDWSKRSINPRTSVRVTPGSLASKRSMAARASALSIALLPLVSYLVISSWAGPQQP